MVNGFITSLQLKNIINSTSLIPTSDTFQTKDLRNEMADMDKRMIIMEINYIFKLIILNILNYFLSYRHETILVVA